VQSEALGAAFSFDGPHTFYWGQVHSAGYENRPAKQTEKHP
jgi:hypothetical protein